MVQVGDKYNHLKVIKRLENHVARSGIQFSNWLCECDCGNFVNVLGCSLTSGHTKSCGCLSKRSRVKDEDMLNKTFGLLTVVSRAPSHKIPSGSVYDMWHCKCTCGNTTVSFGRNLRNGSTQSCGCLRIKRQAEAKHEPKAERWTEEYLKDHHIVFEYQKSFSDLVGQNGGLLSYDFYLPEFNVLLELHGLQHFKPIAWFGGQDGFEKQILHDQRKRSYADRHGYRLIEIPTDHISKKRLFSLLVDAGL